jgi:hypothetical protein
MILEVETITFPKRTDVKIEFSVTATINITAFMAQRKVSKLMLDRVGNLLYGKSPNLVVGERFLWRVPIWLGLPTIGPVGQVGIMDVDAQTGELIFNQQHLDDIVERGNVLAERASHSTN